MSTLLRPAAAARRFGVDERTLSRWAAAGKIGRSKPSKGITLYVTSDITDMIARHTTARTSEPKAAEPSYLGTDEWRELPFWKESR